MRALRPGVRADEIHLCAAERGLSGALIKAGKLAGDEYGGSGIAESTAEGEALKRTSKSNSSGVAQVLRGQLAGYEISS